MLMSHSVLRRIIQGEGLRVGVKRADVGKAHLDLPLCCEESPLPVLRVVRQVAWVGHGCKYFEVNGQGESRASVLNPLFNL